MERSRGAWRRRKGGSELDGDTHEREREEACRERKHHVRMGVVAPFLRHVRHVADNAQAESVLHWRSLHQLQVILHPHFGICGSHWR
jgi:hypothetical protein